MNLRLHHLAETKNSTLSELLHEGERICYILEDGHRENKISGETRIPAGSYEIVPRREGGFYSRYSRQHGHDFVPWLLNVPGFTWILIHIGNTIENTRGCLLTGTTHVKPGADFQTRKSTEAYLELYALLAVAFNQGERVFIEIDRGKTEKEPPEEDQHPEQVTEPAPVLPYWWFRVIQFFRFY